MHFNAALSIWSNVSAAKCMLLTLHEQIYSVIEKYVRLLPLMLLVSLKAAEFYVCFCCTPLYNEGRDDLLLHVFSLQCGRYWFNYQCRHAPTSFSLWGERYTNLVFGVVGTHFSRKWPFSLTSFAPLSLPSYDAALCSFMGCKRKCFFLSSNHLLLSLNMCTKDALINYAIAKQPFVP